MTSDRVAVITVSDRCARGEAEDRSGPTAVSLLEQAGLTDVHHHLVPDGVESVRDVLRAVLDDGARLVITTGGTGIAPRDLTPEGTREVLAGIAGTADGDRALVVNLPGSSGGVRDGLQVVLTLWPHVRSQLVGGDH
jgi:molybdenum cofactor synthesis domain-containing protein